MGPYVSYTEWLGQCRFPCIAGMVMRAPIVEGPTVEFLVALHAPEANW